MGTQATGGGTVTSLNNTPQAGDDRYWRDEEAHGYSYFDVMLNDLGGKAKILWSLDDGGSITDLLAQDGARVESTSSDTSANGAKIWITSTGQVGYNHDTLSAAFQAQLQSLAIGETACDTFRYAIRLANGTLSWATATVVYSGANDAPVISVEADDAAAVSIEETGSGLSASDTLTVRDVDTSDVVDTIVSSVSATGSMGALTSADLLAMLSLSGADDLAADSGDSNNLTWTFDSDGTTFDYLPEGQPLVITYTLTSSDGNGGSDTQTVTITITGTNDAAIITGVISGAVTEDAAPNSVSGNLDSTDVDGFADAFVVVSSPTATASGYGTYTVDGAGNWTYALDNADPDVDALAEGEILGDSFVVQAADGTPQLVTITVTGTNDSPVITTATGANLGAVTEAGNEDDGDVVAGDPDASGQITASDVDNGAVLTYSGSDTGTYGAFAIDADTGAWSYTLDNTTGGAADELAEGDEETDSFLVTVTDEHGAAITQLVTITVTGTNDSPVITTATGANLGAVTEAGNEDDGDVVAGDPDASGQITASDVDNGAVLTYSGSDTGTYGAFAIDADTGAWSYTLDNTTGGAADELAEGDEETDSFLVTVTDEHGAAITQLVTITVTGTNDSPVITTATGANLGAVTEAGNEDDGDVVAGDPDASGQITASDVDNGAVLTYSGSDTGTYGAFAIDADTGAWSYTLDNTTGGAADELAEGDEETDSFLVTVTDEHGAAITQLVTITVTGTNDSPVITTATGANLGAVTEAGNEDDGDVVAGDPDASGQITASDVDNGAVLTYSGSDTGTYGAFAIDADTGAWSYTLDNTTGGAADELAEGDEETDSFLVTVTDEHGAAITQLVTITVTGTNDSPVITTATGANLGAVTEAGNEDDGDVVAGDPDASGQITASDVDNGAVLTYSGSDTGTYGAFAIDADTGAWSYTLDNTTGGAADELAEGDEETDSFLVTVTDEHGAAITQLVTITVTGTNDSPVITTATGANLGAVTEAGNEDDGDVVAGDPDASGQITASDVDNGAVLTYSGSDTGTYGAFAIDADTGAWSYTLDNTTGGAADELAEGDEETDSFLVTVTDEHGAAITQLVTITVTGTNDSPVITTATGANLGAVTEAGNEDDGDVVAGDPDASGQITASDVDNGAVLTYSGSDTGTYGAFAIDADTGAWSYTLDNTTGGAADELAEGDEETDSFLVTVTDEHGAAITQLVTITVTGTNDSPVITTATGANLGAVTEAGNEDDGDVVAGDPDASGQITASDVDNGAVLTYSGSDTGTYGAFAIDADTGAWSYTLDNTTGGAADELAEGDEETDSFLVTVTDEHGAAITQLVTITVTGTNDSPVITTATGANLGAVTEAGNEDDGDVVAGDPDASGQITASDVDNGAVLTYSGSDTGTYGAFAIDADTGAWSYTLDNTTGGAADELAEGDEETDSFLVTVTDEHGAAITQLVTITVTGTNDSPVITTATGANLGAVTEAGNEDDGDVVAGDPDASGQITASDVDNGAVLTYSGSDTGTYGAFAIDADTGAWSYTLDNTTGGAADELAEGDEETDSFLVTVTDEHGAAITQLVTITVTGTNDSPVITTATGANLGAVTEAGNEDDGDVVAGDPDASGQITASDVDNGAVLTYSGSDTGTYGAFAIDADTGAWSYTLDNTTGGAADELAEGDEETDSFLVTVTDEHGAAITQLVTITVTGTNDSPVITTATGANLGAVTEAGNEDDGDVVAGDPDASGQITASDVDNGAVLTYSGSDTGTYGAFAIDADTGAWSYTLDNTTGGAADELAEGDEETDSFLVTVTDEHGAAITQLVTITVTGTNDSPVITTATGANLGAVTEAGNEDDGDVVAGDPDASGQITASDVDNGAVLTYSGSDTGTYGAFAIDADTGAWSYTLDNTTGGAADELAEGDEETDSFLVTVTDEHGAAITQLVTITVTGTNDSPVITTATGANLGAVTEAGNEDDGDVVAGDPDASGQITASDVDNGAVLTYSGSDTGTYGAFAIDADTGAWSYTLDNTTGGAADELAEGDEETDSFLVTVTDEHGAAITQLVTITVTGTNDSPVITTATGANLGAVTEAGNEDDGDVVAGDPDASGQITASDVDNGAVLTYSGSDTGTYGAFAIDADTGAWSYTLDNTTGGAADELAEGDEETDSFLVTVTDEHGAAITQLVTITVTGTNDSPVITTATGANLGAVTEAGNEDDGDVVAGDPDASGQITASDVDNGAVLTYSGSDTGTYGAFAIDADTGAWSYTLDNTTGGAADELAEGDEETDSFLVTVTDEHGAAITQLVTITVTGTNDSPVITTATGANLGAVTEAGNEDDGDVVAGDPDASGQITASDVDNGAVLTYSGSDTGTYGAFAIDADTGAWSYTLDNTTGGAADELAEGDEETDSFLVTVTDEHGAAITQLVTITVTGTNDSPVITTATGANLGAVTEAGNEDDGDVVAGDPDASGQITASDVDNGAVLTYSGSDTGTYGAFAIDADTGAWSYTLDNTTGGAADELAEGDEETDSFLVTVTDEHGAAITQLVTITVTGTNDSPVITSSAQSGSVVEDGPLSATGQVTSSDVDNGATAAYSGNATGLYGSFTVDASTGEWLYTLDNAAHQNLAEGESHSETFTVTVTDDKGGTATQNVVITITGTNDNPVITSNGGGNNASISIAENIATVTTVMATDVDSPTITYSIVGGADQSLFTINSSTGALSFIAAPNFESPADAGANNVYDVTVQASDGSLFDTQAIAVTVTNVAEAPVVANIKFVPNANDFNAGGDLGTGTVIGTFMAFDSAGNVVPGISFGYTSVVGAGLTLNSNGTVVANGIAAGNVVTFNVVPSSGTPESVFFQVGNNNNLADNLPSGSPATGAMLILLGLNGADAVNGGTNDDTLYGGGSNGQTDTLQGGTGDDYLLGGVGNDILRGEGGNDYIRGGLGADTITGGTGVDLFLLTDASSFDTISDYEAGEKIDITTLLTQSGSLTGFVRFTAAGDLQIDADGGGNSYVTVAHISTAGVNATIVYSTGPGTTTTATIIRGAPPIALDLNGDGVISFLATDAGATFDYGGGAVATAWVGPQDGILVRDANGNGDVDDANEIVFATDGSDLEGLRIYDSNDDGQLSAADALFAEFAVWQDADSDGEVDTGELHSLTDAGIAGISLSSDGVPYSAAGGDVQVVGTGSFTRSDGSVGVLADAVFATGGRAADEQGRYLSAMNNNAGLIGAIAAAGLAAAPAAATDFVARQSADDAIPQVPHPDLSRGATMSVESTRAALNNETRDAVEDVGAQSGPLSEANTLSETASTLTGGRAAEPTEPTALLAPSEAPSHDAMAGMPIMAAGIFIPQSEALDGLSDAANVGGASVRTGEVSRVLAEALAGGEGGSGGLNIDAILEGFSGHSAGVNIGLDALASYAAGGAAALNGFSGFMEQHIVLEMDQFVFHQDAIAPV